VGSIDGSGCLRKQPAVAVAAIGSDSDGGEGNSGGVSTAAAVGTAAGEAGRLQPWRQRRRFATMEAAEGGGVRRRQLRGCARCSI
jgi:hypothetical protein